MFENVVKSKLKIGTNEKSADFHIAFGISKAFSYPVGILSTSILENNKDMKIDFHIFVDDKIENKDRGSIINVGVRENSLASTFIFLQKKEAQIHSFRLKYSHHNNILERNGFMLHSNYIQILLNLKDVSIINFSDSSVTIQLPRKPHLCPCCHHTTNSVHDYRLQRTIKNI